MSVGCHVNVKSQSELDIGGRETGLSYRPHVVSKYFIFTNKYNFTLQNECKL